MSSSWPTQIAKLWLIQLPANRRGKRVARRVAIQKLPNGRRSDVACRGAALVERPQKRHAAAGIVFPTILAVEDHADQCGLRPIDCLADAAESHGEVVGGSHRVVALVMEPDQIAQSVIAEHDSQIMTGLGHSIRSVHVARVPHVATVVAADKSLCRAAEDLLVGRNPANAVLS